MNFVKEQVDELNAILKVKVSEADYAERVEKQLKDYQKKANIPGFRPGKVPAGMVKKMYGKSILADEINRMLYDKLNGYIAENKLEILGNPLPRRDSAEINWDTQKEFEFAYDLAFAPQFDLEINDKHAFDYFTVKVDDALVNKYVDDISRRYGKVANVDVADKNDIVFGNLVEVDASGNAVEGGVSKNTSIAVEPVKNEKIKKALIGLTKDSSIVLSVADLKADKADGATILGIAQDKVDEINNNFKFTVSNISRVEPAELNEELFKKVYGETVTTEADFKNKIREELSMMFVADSDRRLKSDVMKKFVDTIKLTLPDEFLKRWLIAVNEKPVTMEQVNAEYDQYAISLRYQLIENKIIRGNNISVAADELKDYVKGLIKEQFAKFNGGATEMDEKELNDTVNRVLANEDESRKLFERLYDNKVLDLFKGKLKLNKKEVSYDDFYKPQA